MVEIEYSGCRQSVQPKIKNKMPYDYQTVVSSLTIFSRVSIDVTHNFSNLVQRIPEPP